MTHAALTRQRADLVAIFRAAIAAVDPRRLVAHHLSREGDRVSLLAASDSVVTWRAPILVVGAGKAAAHMAAACEDVITPEGVHGEVIVAAGCTANTNSIRVSEAGHPLPDARGEAATRRIIELVRGEPPGATLCLISGGASSLLVQPRSPVCLHDKIQTTQMLLACGADINELNCVRKHLSTVKGGGLGRLASGQVASLILSDVVGDDLGTIGSGPTAADPTTFADAWAVLKRYNLIDQLPQTVVHLLRDGMNGRIADTVKPRSREAMQCRNLIVGSNRTALAGAEQAARSQGWKVTVESTPLAGDTTAVARSFGERLAGLARRPLGEPLCVLAGGETTVTVTGTGRGGRNQEFALVLAGTIAGLPISVLSAGTDGIDGPTDAAGAFVDGSTLTRSQDAGLDADAALARHDSHTFFAKLGDLLRCGPTGTNVTDLKVAFVGNRG